MTLGVASQKAGLQEFPEFISTDLRAAITESISLQAITSIKLVFEYGNPRFTIHSATERKRVADVRTADQSSRRALNPSTQIVDRNLKRATGFCRRMAEKIEGDLDRYTRVTLVLYFKAGQVCEVDRVAKSKFETTAD